jgi:hypothetical protein
MNNRRYNWGGGSWLCARGPGGESGEFLVFVHTIQFRVFTHSSRFYTLKAKKKIKFLFFCPRCEAMFALPATLVVFNTRSVCAQKIPNT